MIETAYEARRTVHSTNGSPGNYLQVRCRRSGYETLLLAILAVPLDEAIAGADSVVRVGLGVDLAPAAPVAW